MSERVQGPAYYFLSIEKKYGRPINDWLAALGGQGGLRGVGVVEADDQAGVLGAIEGDLQSTGLPAVHGGEQPLAHSPVQEGPVREPARPVPTENLEVARLHSMIGLPILKKRRARQRLPEAIVFKTELCHLPAPHGCGVRPPNPLTRRRQSSRA